jgi:hypothetical protein
MTGRLPRYNGRSSWMHDDSSQPEWMFVGIYPSLCSTPPTMRSRPESYRHRALCPPHGPRHRQVLPQQQHAGRSWWWSQSPKRKQDLPTPSIIKTTTLLGVRSKYPAVTVAEIMAAHKPPLMYGQVKLGPSGSCLDFLCFVVCKNSQCSYEHDAASSIPMGQAETVAPKLQATYVRPMMRHIDMGWKSG